MTLFRRNPAAPLALLGFLLLASCQGSFTVPANTPANRYALVIGIKTYQNVISLRYPENDADSMRDLLISKGWTVSTLKSAQAGKSAIEAAIAALNPSNDPDATILVYFSGHGSGSDLDLTVASREAWIIPYDATFDTSTWISPDALFSRIESRPARNRIVILDACNSGGFALSDEAADTSPPDYNRMMGTRSETLLVDAALSDFSRLFTSSITSYGSSSVTVLAAAGSKEVAWDDMIGRSDHGVFTNELLKSATYGDEDGDGVVTVDESYRYAKSRILADWNAKYYYLRDQTGAYTGDFLPHISGGTGDLALF